MNHIVCGPPGSGKTTSAREHMKPGDVIVDLDMIFHAFTGLPMYQKPSSLLPFMMEIRRFAIDLISRQPFENPYASTWIIIGGAKRFDREKLRVNLNAEIIILDVDASECIRRISADQNRHGKGIAWGRAIKKWWQEYIKTGQGVYVE